MRNLVRSDDWSPSDVDEVFRLADAIEHPAFNGHRFKKSLAPVQQAVMALLSALRNAQRA
jgi:hypothetical protein